MTLSVLVQADRIWVGLSRVNEFQEIPKKGEEHDWEKFETTLKEHKASAFFADRSDIESLENRRRSRRSRIRTSSTRWTWPSRSASSTSD